MTTLNDAVSFASLKQLRRFRAPKYNGHSSEWLCCYRAAIQYWTLSPVDFCSPTVILILSSCMIYIFRNGFWFLVPFFGGTSATFLDLVRSSDSLSTKRESAVYPCALHYTGPTRAFLPETFCRKARYHAANALQANQPCFPSAVLSRIENKTFWYTIR